MSSILGFVFILGILCISLFFLFDQKRRLDRFTPGNIWLNHYNDINIVTEVLDPSEDYNIVIRNIKTNNEYVVNIEGESYQFFDENLKLTKYQEQLKNIRSTYYEF